MAFPTTSTIDNFNRTESPISDSGKWSFVNDDETIELFAADGSHAYPVTSGLTGGGYRNDQTYGPDTEVFLTVVTEPDPGAAGDGVTVLYARLTSVGPGTTDGYRLDCPRSRTGADEWRFKRIDNGVSTQIGSSVFQEIADGDSVGFCITGSTLEAWYKSGAGAWTSLGTVTDSTYSGAGYIGCAMNYSGTLSAYDNFGGGTVVPSGGGGSPAAGPLPVVPGAYGFGMETRAAYTGGNPTVLRVTNLNDSGAGSLRAALETTGNRVVIFETSGEINCGDDEIQITSGNLTVAGQTAPSPGITLRKGGIQILAAHDILLQHFRIRVGDEGTPVLGDTARRDGILVYNQGGTSPYGIVLDHMSVSWAPGKNLNLVAGLDATLTCWRCITAEGLYRASNVTVNPGAPSSLGLLSGVGELSIFGTLFAHNADRNPELHGGTNTHVINNVVYDWGRDLSAYPWGTFFYGPSSDAPAPWKADVIGNVYIGGISTHPFTPLYAIGTWAGEDGSELYLSDTLVDSTAATVLEYFNNMSFDPRAGSAPVSLSGITVNAASVTKAFVLANAGARPLDRDAVDTRIIASVSAYTGTVISSQSEVGSWPTLAVNTRALTTPANPHVVQASGYTNLEEWLQSYAAGVEPSSGSATVFLSPVTASWVVPAPTIGASSSVALTSVTASWVVPDVIVTVIGGTTPTPAATIYEARANVERAGASYAGYYTPNMIVTINGVVRTSVTEIATEHPLTIHLATQSEPCTATLTLKPGATIPQAGEWVALALGSAESAIFYGQIARVTHRRLKATDAPSLDLDCVDGSRWLNRRLVTYEYVAMSATAIAEDLVTSWAASVTTRFVQANLPVVASFPLVNVGVVDALTQLANLIGGGHYLTKTRAAATLDLHFYGADGETGMDAPTRPLPLTESLAVLGTFKRFTHTLDVTQERTRDFVEVGGQATVPLEVPAGATEFPVSDASAFAPHGGRARLNTQRLAYTRASEMAGLGANGLLAWTDEQVAAGATSFVYTEYGNLTRLDSLDTHWFQAGNQVFLANTVTDGELSDIPTSGYGSLASDLGDKTQITPLPMLSGVTGIVVAQPQGTAIVAYAQVDRVDAQTAIGAIEGGDGIHEFLVDASQFPTVDSGTPIGEADIDAFSDPLLSAEWVTEDMNAIPGVKQVVHLASSDPLSATLTIETADLTFTVPNRAPMRSVRGSLVKRPGLVDALILR